MRRRLILMFVAISLMVALAFVVPLGFLVRRTAEDRAIDLARADAAAVVPALVSGGTRAQIESAVGATESGRDERMTVRTASGWDIGTPIEASPRLEAALATGASAIGPVDGGVEVVAAVATGSDELSAIRVFVPDPDLRRGQWRAWATLALVAVALVGISVVVADRLARTVVRPTQELAAAARRLGGGDLDASVDPDGPNELVDLAVTFNDLGSRVSSMLNRERELVAELSHRLRTPLTKLRMRVDQVDDDELSAALRADLDDVTGALNELIDEARGKLDGDDSCDVAEVVTERVEFWSVLADDQGRPWRFERGRGRCRVGVAEPDLAAAVDVLIDNVFSHTPEGTAFTIGFSPENGSVRIWVADAGDGIEEAALYRGTSSAGSTGLGLDIARRMSRDANGSFSVEASAQGGAEVSVVLPLLTP